MKYFFAKRTYFAGIIGLIVIVLFVRCNNEKYPKPNNDKEKVEIAKPADVEAFILNKSNLTSSVKIPGELIAFQQVDLYAKVNSYIKKMQVDVGSEVKAKEKSSLP